MLAIILLLILLSCGSKKTVTDTIMVHNTDTVKIHHTDSVKDVKYVNTSDSVKEKEYHTYIINNVGDTVKEIHHYHNNEKIIIVDSSHIYKVEIDSLRAMLEREKTKTHEKVKTKKTISWEMICLMVLAAILAILALRKEK